MTDAVPALRIGSAPREGRGWLLALDDQWVPLTIGLLNDRLSIEATEKNEPGVSGSPILADDGTAMAIVCVGREVKSADGVRKAERSSPHPILLHSLQGWVLQRQMVARKRN